MSRFGATPITAPKPSRFGARPVTPPEPANLREFVGEDTARTLTPETAISGGHVDDFVSFLRGKADKLEVGSPEREQLAKTIAGLQGDIAEFRTQRHEANRRGTSVETAARLASPVGAAEQAIAQTAVGQTLLRAEQGLSNIAETGLSLASRAIGSGRMSANLHRDKAARDQFLQAAEAGGQIDSTLGETGSRVYNSVVNSVAKFGAASVVSGPSAVYSLIAGESYDDAVHEAEQAGFTGVKQQVYAVTKGAVETGLTILMGKVGKRLGLSTFEESLSPGMRKAAQQLATQAVGKSGLSKLATEAASVGLEAGEELLIDAVQQGVELQAGTSKKFDWSRLMEAGAAGAFAKGATGAKDIVGALRKLPSQKIEETVSGVKAAEIAAGVAQPPATPSLGMMLARRFFETATPEQKAAVKKHINQKEFAALTGIKKSSQTFREAFRSTMELYEKVPQLAGQAPQTTDPAGLSQNETPQSPAVASEAPPVTSDPSAAGAPTVTAPAAVATEIEQPSTSARRADVDRDRELFGLPEIPDAESRPWAQALDMAKTNNVPARAMTIAREIAAEPRALSDVETAGFVVKLAELKNEYDALQQTIQAADQAGKMVAAVEQQRVQDEFDELSAALRSSGTEKGRALAAQKLKINQAYDLISVASRAKVAKGEALSDKDKAGLESLVRKLEEIEKKIGAHKGTPDELAALEYERDQTKREIKFKIRDLKPQNLWHKSKGVADISRALITSGELSAVLRQGGFIAFSRPEIAARSLGPMFRAARSPVAADQINKEILARPNAQLYQAAKLFLHDENADPSAREEAFASSWMAKTWDRSKPTPFFLLPAYIARSGVQASQRAYTTFLNKLRADTFDFLVATMAKNGEPTLKEARAIANYINVATGRGGIAKFDRAIGESSAVFFAPRYVVSRFQLLAGQPLYGGTTRTKKLLAGEYARYLLGMTAFYSLAELAFGDDEGFSLTFNPTSSDFGKLNFNGTRIDPLAGLSQATTFLARTLWGQSTGPNGRVTDLRGKNARGSWASTAGRFARTKLAPVPGMAVDILSGENVVGEPVSPLTLAVGAGVPLSWRDVGEAMESQGVPRGTAMATATFFGMGLQTYGAH